MPRHAIMLVTALSAGAAPATGQIRGHLDWSAMANRVVEQMAIERGEHVLLVGHPGVFEEFVSHFRHAVRRRGGIDLGIVDVMARPTPAAWSSDRSAGVEPARAAYRAMLQRVDASVMLPGATTSDAVYLAIQDLLRAGRGRTVHFHWLENGSAFALPGQPLPPADVVDRVYFRALIETDYAALAATQRRFEDAMRSAEVRVTTPLGTDLQFRIGDRPVNRQDGNATRPRMSGARILIDREIELPAGAVRVAPIETTVNGRIAFPPSQWNGRPVWGLVLEIENGRVVEVRADRGIEHVEREMQEAGAAARRFREFALGFNPLLAVPDVAPWIPYYGYGAGVVRLSLGDNSELGGEVTGGYVRWNFFTDATVKVGDEIWVRNGVMLER